MTDVLYADASGNGMGVLDLGDIGEAREIAVSPAGVLNDTLNNVLYSEQFPNIYVGLAIWMATGGKFVINEPLIALTRPFTVNDGTFLADKNYELTSNGHCKLLFTGLPHGYALRFYSNGRSRLTISGNIELDCNNLCGTGIWFQNEAVSGNDRRDYDISGIKVTNCRMKTGTALYDGSQLNFPGGNGMTFSGGFDFLYLHNFEVDGVTRDAGAGIPSRGSAGVSINGSNVTTSNPKKVLIEKFKISNVGTEDAHGTADYANMDGLLMFYYKVGNDDVSAPVVRKGKIKECWGRAVKRYTPMFGGSTTDLEIWVSGYSVGNGGSNDIAHQDGSGYVARITLNYSGNANSVPRNPVGFSLAVDADAGGGVAEDIVINDTTGAEKACLVKYTSGSVYTRRYRAARIKDTGSSRQLIDIGGLGASADAFFTLRDIDCDITLAATQTEDTLTYLQVDAKRVKNRNATMRPLVVTNAGVERTVGIGQWKGDASVRGFPRYTGLWRGNPSFRPGFYGPGGGVETDPPYGKEAWTGPIRFGLIELATGATWDGPASGLYEDKGGDYRARIWRHDNASGSHLEFYTNANETALTDLYGAGVGITLTDGGAAAGGAIFEVYKDMATQSLHVRNGTAGTVKFALEINA